MLAVGPAKAMASKLQTFSFGSVRDKRLTGLFKDSTSLSILFGDTAVRMSTTFIEYLPSREYISLDTGASTREPDEKPFLFFYPPSLCEETPLISPDLVTRLRSRRLARLVESSTPRTTRTPRSHKPAKPSPLAAAPELSGLDPRTKELLLKALSRKGR